MGLLLSVPWFGCRIVTIAGSTRAFETCRWAVGNALAAPAVAAFGAAAVTKPTPAP